MDAREFILSARKEPSLAGPIFTKLPWLLARSLSEFMPYVTVKESSAKWNEQLLQEAVREFHDRAGTLTPAIRNQISRLKPGNIVRLSHQPNLFAYIKLIGQFLALHLLSTNSGFAPLYYFIDYDTSYDSRFNRSNLPDPMLPTGSRRLQLPRAFKAHRTALANHVPVPPEEWLNKTYSTIQAAAKTYNDLRLSDGPIELRLSTIQNDLEVAWRNARDVAEMNAILLSRFVNLWLDVPIPFVPGSFLWSQIAPLLLEKELRTVTEVSEALHWAHNELSKYGVELASREKTEQWLPWWAICDCGSRVGLSMHENQIVFGTCPHCSSKLGFDVKEANWEEGWSTQTAPRIILHNLLNITGFGYQAGVNHIGSAEHVLMHSLAMTRLSRPALPQWLWQCSGPFGTALENKNLTLDLPFQREATEVVQNGNASFVYFALCRSPEKLSQVIEHKILGNKINQSNE